MKKRHIKIIVSLLSVIAFIIFSIKFLIPFILFGFVPACPEYVPTKESVNISSIYEEIVDTFWGQKGYYVITTEIDNEDSIIIKESFRNGGQIVKIIEKPLSTLSIDCGRYEVPPTYMRVLDKSIQFGEFGIYGYKLVYADSLFDLISDLYNKGLKKGTKPFDRYMKIADNWYYIYY